MSAHGSPLAWVERFLAWRDRLLVRPAFQRWASGFWLTRPLARAHAGALFDLVAGFVYSQVLRACLELGLFETLAEAPQTAASLAPRLKLSVEACERLLAAAHALRLVQPRGRIGEAVRWGLSVRGAALVGNGGLRALVAHHAALYADLADPVALLRAAPGELPGQLARYWPYAGAAQPETLAPQAVAEYSALMAASAGLVVDELLAAYPVQKHQCLLDVGGGEGAFVLRAAAQAPGLGLMLFDLPSVAARARERLTVAGLADRCQVHGGNFFADELPRGADLISLLRVVYDHDDAPAQALLRSARKALAPGGTLVLAEPMAQTGGAEAMGDAYFGMYLLAMGSGRPRSAAKLTGMLRSAGFDSVTRLPTRIPMQAGLLVAR